MNKRSMFFVICALVLGMLCVSASASAYVTGGYDYRISGGEATVLIKGSNRDEIKIPESVDGVPVTAVEYNKAEGKQWLQSLVLPESIEVIANEAFMGCDELSVIVLGDKVRSIGENAFADTKYYNSIANWDNGGLYVGNYLIKVSPWVSGTFEVKNGTTLIADGCFKGCTKINEVIIPDSVRSVGKDAFENTGISMVAERYEEGALYVGKHLVAYKGSSAEYTVKAGTLTVASGVFEGADKLEKLILPDSVVSMGEGALKGCKALREIYLPKDLRYIGEGNFGDAEIESISMSSENEYYSLIDGILYDKSMETLLCCPKGFTGKAEIPDGVKYVDEYAFYGCGGVKEVILPSSIVAIGDKCFYGCSSLKTIVFPESLLRIGRYAFGDCVGLSSVSIPDGVRTLGEGAFEGCKSLGAVIVGKGVTKIEPLVFGDCVSLDKVQLLSYEICEFSGKAFLGSGFVDNRSNYNEDGQLIVSDRYLIKVLESEEGVYRIPSGITHIVDGCFDSFTKACTVYLPETLRYIGDGAIEADGEIDKIVYGGSFRKWQNNVDCNTDILELAVFEPSVLRIDLVVTVIASLMSFAGLWVAGKRKVNSENCESSSAE